jgi:alpha-mannosidase
MGHEYSGGFLRRETAASDRPVRLQIREEGDSLEVVSEVDLAGQRIRRQLWFGSDSPLILGRVEGRAAARRTVALSFETGLAASGLAMAQPGGVVERPLRRWYEPTFWPLQHFVHVQEPDDGRGLAAFVRFPAAVSCSEGGRLELVALRNATRERAYGVLPLPATPAKGYEREEYAFEYALLFTHTGDWRVNDLPALARALYQGPWRDRATRELWDWADAAVRVTGPEGVPADVTVSALKPASRGEGLILRLVALAAPEDPVTIELRGQSIRVATLCDARERDLEELPLQSGRLRLRMPGPIVTLRIRPRR